MKNILILLLVIGLLLWANNQLFGQSVFPVPIEVTIPVDPKPVKAGGKFQLYYELHITNFSPKNLELTRVEVFGDEVKTKLLASYKDAELNGSLSRPGTAPDLSNKRIIGGGMRAVVFLQVAFNTEAEIPRSLFHRLTFGPDEANPQNGERVFEYSSAINRSSPLVIESPLRGEGWLAANGISNTSIHRRAMAPVNGKARIAQRFATDWIKIGTDGKLFKGNPADNANWYAYGTEVLAVANAKVASVKDGIPENDPSSSKRAVPITLETIGGNYVILDLGNGLYAFYAHLQPKSLRVKVGDKVKKGEVLGLLGNSGNSTAPHLHFHISDANSPLGAEGIPFVFKSFEVLGAVKSLAIFSGEESWKPNSVAEKFQLELPVENAVVRFK